MARGGFAKNHRNDGSESAEDRYWQGPYYGQGVAELPASPRYGSVSPRARRLYASEEMYCKDHIAAALFAVFLGVFGIHKFYLGYNQAGFSMLAFSIIGSLLTFGLAAVLIEVIAIIEAVIYLSKSQAQFQRIYVMNQRDWF